MTRPTQHLALVTLVLASVGAGCLVDDDRPAAPIVDGLRPRTSLADARIAGVAEYFATVTATGPGGSVSAVADGRTGLFALQLPLSAGDNAISITAADDAGNVSEPVEVVVVQEPARAETVRVNLPRTVIDADSGALEVIVDISNDEAEIPLTGLGVTLTIPELADFAPLPIAVNDTGHAVVVLEDLRRAGTMTVRVEADVADLAGARAFDQAGFTVLPGRPAVVDVSLSATVDGTAVGPENALTVPAGTLVDVDVAVSDAHGNAVEGAAITIDAPGSGAAVLGDRLADLTRAGTFDVVADTGVGLVSGTATLTVTAAAPDHVELSLDAGLVQAGTAVTAQARVVDAFGNTVTDAVPAFDIDAPQDFGAPLVNAGVATATVTVTLAGAFTVTASDPASTATPATAPLQIVAGVPVNGNFIEIDAAGLPYQAGDAVFVNYELLDAFGNVNSTSPVVVTVNAPNVAIADNGAGTIEVNGIVRAGTYVVRGRAVGTGLPDDVETLVVGPNPELAGFNLVLSASLVTEFGTLVFSGTDGFGNLIDESQITTTVSDPSVVRSGSQLTFGRPGSFSITACVTGTTLCDTEFVSVQGLIDTIPPTVDIVIETPVGSNTVVRGQRIVFRVDVSDDRALSELRFVATFGDNGVCTRTGGPVLFSASTTESRTFSFTVPNCAIPLDVVNIVAQAADEAGNTRNGADASLSVLDPFTLQTGVDPQGGTFVVAIAAFQDRLDIPSGIAVQEASGTFFVANAGNDRAVGVPIDRVQFELRDQNNNRIDLLNARGTAATRAGSLFFGVDDVINGSGSSGIIRVRQDLVDEIFVDSARPGGQAELIGNQQLVNQLVVDESAGPPAALCMVISAQDHLYCYGNLDAQPIATTRLAELELTGLRPRGIGIDPANDPGVLNDVNDVLFVAFNRTVGGSRIIRPFRFNAARTTLTAFAGADISLNGLGLQDDDLGDLVVGPGPERNIYVADRRGGRVLRIERATGAVSTFVSGLSSPVGLAFEGGLNAQALLISDDNDRVVFRVLPDAGNPGLF